MRICGFAQRHRKRRLKMGWGKFIGTAGLFGAYSVRAVINRKGL